MCLAKFRFIDILFLFFYMPEAHPAFLCRMAWKVLRGDYSFWINYTIFRPFFKDEKCKQKHTEFRNELCVFFVCTLNRQIQMDSQNILMRICQNASALMELMMRLELMTSSLPRMCATTCATSASCPLGQLCYDTTFGGILQAFFWKKSTFVIVHNSTLLFWISSIDLSHWCALVGKGLWAVVTITRRRTAFFWNYPPYLLTKGKVYCIITLS